MSQRIARARQELRGGGTAPVAGLLPGRIMGFDRLAPFYRRLEWVLAGGKLQTCRLRHIHALKDCQRVLLAGEGHGRFLTELVRRYPLMNITYADQSPGMLKAAKTALASAGLAYDRVTFQQADLVHAVLSVGVYDAIVTHFFLDCFSPQELSMVVANLSHSANDRAVWLLSDFCEAQEGWRHLRSRLILKLMYWFFRRATKLSASYLTDPMQYLPLEGFRLHNRVEFEWGLMYSCLLHREP